MKTLTQQIEIISQAAYSLIRRELKKNNGFIEIENLESLLNRREYDDELPGDFTGKTTMINEYIARTDGYEDLYFRALKDGDHEANVFLIDEYGNEETLTLWELSEMSRAQIADILNKLSTESTNQTN